MTMALRRALPVAIAAMCFASPALAHSGHEASSGFHVGFLHAIHGADHLVAMLAFGFLAGMAGGCTRLLVPAVLVVFTALGGLAGAEGFDLPYLEAAIALSLAVLGMLIALEAKLIPAALAGFAAVGALVHGAAHGAEMPAGADGMLFGLGLLAAIGLLAGAGSAFEHALRRSGFAQHLKASRLVGLGTLAAGAVAAYG